MFFLFKILTTYDGSKGASSSFGWEIYLWTIFQHRSNKKITKWWVGFLQHQVFSPSTTVRYHLRNHLSECSAICSSERRSDKCIRPTIVCYLTTQIKKTGNTSSKTSPSIWKQEGITEFSNISFVFASFDPTD